MPLISKIRKYLSNYTSRADYRPDDHPKPNKVSPIVGHAETEPFFECLVRLQFAPEHIVDVGANRGDWTKTALRYFPHARFTLFEPQDDLLRGGDLDGDARVNICAMGAGPNTATMKLSKHERDDSFSFALSERQAIELGREQIDAPVVALDEFLARQGLPLPDLLKIDAEGWDLEVLKGAEKCVNNADVILLEAAVMNKAFTNTIANVITEMDRQDFMLFDVTDLNRTKRHGVLWLVELAFVRKRGQLAMAVDSYT